MISPQFKTFVISIVALILLVLAMRASAETVVTPYFSLGAYHRDCALSDPAFCKNPESGSDTPGTIDLGIRLKPSARKLYFLGADNIDIGWHHQSYVDRGYLIPGMEKKPGGETQIDMYGVRWTWEIKSLSFTLGI